MMRKLAILCCASLLGCEGLTTVNGRDPTDLDMAEDLGRLTPDQGQPSPDLSTPERDMMSSDLGPAQDMLMPPIDMFMPPMGPCAGRADGQYCAQELGLAQPKDLIQCAQGAVSSQQECQTACAQGADAATSRCVDDSVEPCFNDPDGVYCGHAIGAAHDPNSLFDCRDKRTVNRQACASWCHVQGGDDVCANNQIDACFDDADGDYCGGYIGSSSNQDSLFLCRGKRTIEVRPCPAGCGDGGSPHRCKEQASRCLTRPPGTFVRGFSACGNGGSHHGIDLGSPLGTQIPSGVAGEVVSVATGHPNCPYNASTGTCPSSCINNFNYVKIKVDGGDPRRAGHDLYVYYLHVNGLAAGIGNGARVSKGQLIAYVGNSGCSSGPHIHLETVSVPSGQRAYLATCNSFDPASIYCP